MMKHYCRHRMMWHEMQSADIVWSIRKQELNWKTSIVDLLKLIDIDSSREERNHGLARYRDGGHLHSVRFPIVNLVADSKLAPA